MKHRLALLASSALLLTAADFWTSKPFTEWSPKDLQKIMTDSPWAKKTAVLSLEGPSAPSMGGTPSRGGRGGGGDAGGDSAPPPLSEKGGGGGGGMAAMPSAEVVVSWPTARPLKQANVKVKYGKEVETSAEAKAFLEREEPNYIIEVNPLQVKGRTGDDFRQALVKSAVLNIKGKDSIHATDAQVSIDPRRRTLDIFFMFPRQRALTLEDAEVEFNVKAGEVPIKQRFKLKDMVFNGKLEL